MLGWAWLGGLGSDEWCWMSGLGWVGLDERAWLDGVGWKGRTSHHAEEGRRHPPRRCQERVVDATRQVVVVDEGSPLSVFPGKGMGWDGKGWDGIGWQG